MKKLNGIFCALMMAVFLFTVVSAVCAALDKENFQKAGMTLKEQAETNLRISAGKVQDYFCEIPNNGYFGKRAMWNLDVYVGGFEKSRTDYDESLKLYDLRTETVLDPVYRKIVDIYFLRDEMSERSLKNDFLYGDSKNEDIRRIFAERTGVDVKVWRSLNKSRSGIISPIVVILSIIAGLIVWLRTDSFWRVTVAWIIFPFLFFFLPF